jgi:hypothetical protein
MIGNETNRGATRSQYLLDNAWDEATKLPLKLKSSDADSRQEGGNHYASMLIQPSDFIHANQIGWCEGNVIKYVCRHQRKNGAEDIKKAIHYLELLLQWEYGG